MDHLKEMAEAWFEQVWNQRSDDAIFELSAKNAVGYAESDVRYFSMEAFKEFRDNVIAAVPDCHMQIEAIIQEGPHVAVRWFFTGTHTGNGFGFFSTNSRLSFRGMTWLHADETGMFHEGWDCWNMGRFMQVLVGAGPPNPDEPDEEE